MDKKKKYLERLEKQIAANKKIADGLIYAKNFVLPFFISSALMLSISFFFPTTMYFTTSIVAYIFIALSYKEKYDTYLKEEAKRLNKEKKDIEQETITTMDNTKENKIKLEKNKTKNDKTLKEEEEENHKKLASKLKFSENWFKASLIAYVISTAGVLLFSPYFLAGVTMSAVSAFGITKDIKNKKGKEQQSLGIINTTKRLNAIIEEKVDSIKKVLSSPVEEGKEKEPTSKAKTEDKIKTSKSSEPIIPLEGYFDPHEMESGKVKKIGTKIK